MRCFIHTCNSEMRKVSNGISSHRFPKNDKKRIAWLKILDPSGTRYDDIKSSSRICSRHFLETDFYDRQGKRKLNPDAVPSVDLDPGAVGFEYPAGTALYSGREPWDIPRKKPQPRTKNPEKIWIKPVNLKNAHLDQLSPRLAKHVLPKVYRQLQSTTDRLNRYKHQCLYFRNQVVQLKSMMIEMSARHGIPLPEGVRNRPMPVVRRMPPQQPESDTEEMEPDPLAGQSLEILKSEPPELEEDQSEPESRDDGDNDDDYRGARLEDKAVEQLMSAL